MSQDAYDPELVAAFQQQYVETIILNSLTALVAYEYVITLGQEITTMWRRGLSGATLLFFFNRYLMVLSVILVYVPFSAKLFWNIEVHRSGVVGAIRHICTNVLLLLIVLILNLVPFGTNLYDFSIASPEYYLDPIFGQFCSLPIPPTPLFDLWLPIATRAVLVAADALVIILTWIKTYDTQKTASSLNIKTPLLSLFFRDGTIYFVALLLMNIMHILLQSVSVMQSLSPATLFFSTLTPILISRFLLNLRQLDRTSDALEDSAFSQFSIPGFRYPSSLAIGNLGASLEHMNESPDLDLDISAGAAGVSLNETSGIAEALDRTPEDVDTA